MSFVLQMRWFFAQRWRQYAVAIVLMTIVSLLSIVPPKMIGSTIDQIRTGTLTADGLRGTVLLLVVLALFLYAMIYIWITTLFGNAILLEKMMRSRLLRHWTRMTPTFFQRNSTGELMALATNDVLAVGQTAGYGVMTLVNTVVGASVVIVTMVSTISFKLMLAALVPMPFVALSISVLGKRMRTRFVAAQTAFGKMNDQALESISGLRVVRSYVQEEHDIEAFDRVTKDVMEKNIRVAAINAMFHPLISSIVGLSMAIGNGYGAYLVFHDQITLGQLVSFNIYLGMLIWPMIAFGEFINVLQRGSASADRLMKSFSQQPDVTDAEETVHVEKPYRIEATGLSFRYPGAAADSLKDVSFRLERGETLGLVGRTGSGKSTLLKQLLRQYPIDPNRLWIANVPIERIELGRVRGWIGYVPQEHLLLSKTIRENIAVGKPDATDAEIRHVLEMACFAGDVEQMPDGWDTLIGENGVMLSGGQKQRVGIARALLADPEVLILDDSLSAVDAKTESFILHNIRKERAGRTTFIATHRLSAVQHANWILVLGEGRVVEEGTHEQLMMKGGWYKEQFERQQMEASLLE
ncbi:ABC transporter ATP-binding protein [Paenibacillus hamazuiensis]|uniref:ABC transporter ATP-binding protein n=1 Tax=Paenibacillus hamazuiensis TaxID=2936508 RepID=UPI00200C4FDC|nr:ABC transporter transmembrane domain-containing protein [Paenibacillus hamazuiensis]